MSGGPVGQIGVVSLFASRADRDRRTDWHEGDIAGTKGEGYSWYDGSAWQPLGAGAAAVGVTNPTYAQLKAGW